MKKLTKFGKTTIDEFEEERRKRSGKFKQTMRIFPDTTHLLPVVGIEIDLSDRAVSDATNKTWRPINENHNSL